MSALDFYEEMMDPGFEPVSPLRYNARHLANRSDEPAFVTNGGPEAMIPEIIPEGYATAGRGIDGSAH